jgi:disulfide bond formation protein DsbB
VYEQRKHQLLTRKDFAVRVARHFGIAVQILGLGLGIGILGYHFVAELSWIDSLLNASMILAGMGPVDSLHSSAAKVFASCYAMFSGLAFIGIASLIVAPFAHRLLHRFHLDSDDPHNVSKLG